MPQIQSHLNVSVVINGRRFAGGWADEDQPVEFPSDDDLYDLSRSPDGGLYGINLPTFGGEVMFRFAPNSPDVQWWIQQLEMKKQNLLNQSAHIEYSGTYADILQGRAARFEGGLLTACPPMVVPNTTFEVGVTFEQIISEVDGANFALPQFNVA